MSNVNNKQIGRNHINRRQFCKKTLLFAGLARFLPLELSNAFANPDIQKKMHKQARYVMGTILDICLLYTSPSPRDATLSRMPSSA